METTLLPDYFTNSLCRLCAEKSTKLTSIINNRSLLFKVNKCLPIHVAANDNLPVKICDNCEIKVDETYLLHETCLSAEQKLKWLWNNFLKTKEGEIDNSNAILISQVMVVEDEIQIVEDPNVIVTLPDEVFNEEQGDDLSDLNERNVAHAKIDSDKLPTGLKKYQCRFCSKQLSTLSSMSVHESTHSAEKPYLCDSCGKSFKHANNLRSHTRTHLNIRKKFVCKVCGKSFVTNFFLQEHMNSHTGETPYKCNDCGKEFREKVHLRQHKFTHSTDKFICEICGTKFNRKGNMKEHIKKQHINKEEKKITAINSKDEKPNQHYQCSICDKILENEAYFKTHVKTHSKQQSSHFCVICGKKFRHSGSLTYHRRTAHTGEKPFQCSYCDQKFSLRSVQKIHERRNHTGEQPYNCAFCPKKFTNSSSLKNHSYIHMKVKIFNCNDCGKKFARKSNLLVHMKLHANDRQFTCDQCGKSYIQKHDLIKHKKIHDPKQKPFFCKYCGNNFSHKKDASKHTVCQLDYARRKSTDICSGEKILDSVSNAFNKSSDNLFEAEQLILETVKNLSNFKT